MTAAIRAPQPLHHTTVRPSVRLVDPAWFPMPADDAPRATPPLRLIPGGRDAARRRRRADTVYRRRRWAAVLLLVTLVFGLLAGARALENRLLVDPTVGSTTSPGSPAGSAAAVGAVGVGRSAGLAHVVQPGDSLWSIARSLQPEGDIRPLVDRLAERSGGGSLQVGQRLELAGLSP